MLFLVLASGALFLERSAITLDGEFRFTPATPFYLAAGLLAQAGVALMAVVLLVETLSRRPRNFLQAMEGQASITGGLLASGLALKLGPDAWWAPAISGPAVFSILTLSAERATRSRLSAKERIHWLQARMQIRPLQLTLAVSSWGVAALALSNSLLPVVFIPALIACGYAAENVVLKARDASTEQVLHELADARGQQRQAAAKLAQAQTEKQLMEGFSAHLAHSPGLLATSQALVATVHQLVAADDVAVFLSSDPAERTAPEPFYHRVEQEHQDRLSGLALTALREELIDECWSSGQPRVGAQLEETPHRLFKNNRVAAAFPLAKLGVLYVGRREDNPLTRAEQQRLRWLAEKARLAFESAFRDRDREKRQAVAQRKLQELQQRVALLGSLIRSAQEMAATLQLEELADRLSELLKETIRHRDGIMVFSWDGQTDPSEPSNTIKRAWGSGGPPRDLSLLQAVERSGQPLLINDITQSPFTPPTEQMASLIASPLLAHEKVCGVIVLSAPVPDAFSQEQLNQLHLIAYQAGMAFSNARLYGQVVVARQQLEESQESLIFSSKMSAIGKLAAGVAHELNTPLGVMHLALEQASELLSERPEAAQRMIDKALKAIERSQSITERLLAYSRKPATEDSPVRLDLIVRETVEFLTFELNKAQLSPELELEEVTVNGRAQELQQVLVNLMLNAAQAMESLPQAERALRVTLKRSAGQAVLEAIDRGPGITPEQKAQIFEPFYTTKPVGKGTGLGLWVSLQIIEQHRGAIEYDPNPSGGAIFRLRMPAL